MSKTYTVTRHDGRAIEIRSDLLMRSFLQGESMQDLANGHGVDVWQIEKIIRKETPDKWRDHE